MVLNVILFLESLGGGELLVIILFVLMFFGSKSIPGLARGLGRGMREFKDAMNGVQNELRSTINEPVKSLKEELPRSLDQFDDKEEKPSSDIKKES